MYLLGTNALYIVFYEISQNLPISQNSIKVFVSIKFVLCNRVHKYLRNQTIRITFPSQIKDLIDGRNVQNRALVIFKRACHRFCVQRTILNDRLCKLQLHLLSKAVILDQHQNRKRTNACSCH